jgi:aldehyde:ferredoxin oxidoreductase
MPNGYTGRILHVQLSEQRTWVETPPEAFYRKYLGGSAMGLAYLLQELKPETDPLSPDNILTLMLSVLTGAPISGQSRMTASAKSPLVSGIGDAQCGGFFPAELKFAGFDGIVIRGRAPQPVYLWIKDGAVELRDAQHLWGRITGEAEQMIRTELGDERIEVAQIGPAGEKQVRVAAIMNMSNRANGRCGLGAVMGSKNLKAIAVRGKSKRLPLADAKRVHTLAKIGAGQVDVIPDMRGLADMGTAGVLSSQQMTGTLPTRNFGEGQFEGFEPISGEAMTETILKERDTCYSCSVRCKRVVETEFQSRPVERHYGGPEYETLGTFGSYCAISDLNAVAMAGQLCNQYGMDTIGCGATIAWAMECFEHGLLSETEVGYSLRFGDAAAMVRLTEQIGRREGFGDVLAEGSARAADRIGRGHEFLITVKGSEAPAHMPQAKRSLGLIYAVNAFGADHQSSEHDPMIEEGSASDLYMQRQALLGFERMLAPRSLDREKVRYAFRTQQMYSFLDSADLCQFVYGPAWTLYGPAETVEVVRAITGWGDFSIEEMLQVGERRINMLRAFNAREGLTRTDDRLPKKFFKALRGTGPTAGVALDEAEIERAKDVYYEFAGWSADLGLPSEETLARLGLDWLSAPAGKS